MMSTPAATETTSAVERAPGALEDKALVDAAQSGNALAFIELCQRHSKRLIWRINRITKNWEDAEDALQDTLLRAYRNLNRFENRCTFSSWLTAIGTNSALMLLRRKRRVGVSLDDSYDYLEIAEPACSGHGGIDPESHYESQEKQHLLNTAIRRLPRVLRTVTELRIDRDYSVGEIASALRISKSAVKSRLARARCHLRATLTGAGLETDSRCYRPGTSFHHARVPFDASSAHCGIIARHDPGDYGRHVESGPSFS
jgi:RNA polymerase sigma-70 factor, ECF subfamily